MPNHDSDKNFAPVYVEKLTVRNFRGIGECVLDLEPGLTIIVGRNNAGKSRLLRALAIVLGATGATRDDLTIDSLEEATIDVVIAPRVKTGEESVFSLQVGQRLSLLVQSISEDPIVERVAWRAIIKPSREGMGVRTDYAALIFDQNSGTWESLGNPRSLTGRERSIVAADLVETRRDLADEFTRRNSPISRILDDLEIVSGDRQDLSDELRILGEKIMQSSGSLAALKESLSVLAGSIDEIGYPELHALPTRLEELARSVSISLNSGLGDYPLRLHGSGARSLASIQVQSVLYDRRLGRDGPTLLPHPVSLIEEPEVHLHPQAQFELHELLNSMRGQVVTSSHSAHLVSVAEPSALRVLQTSPAGAKVVDFKPGKVGDSHRHRALNPQLHLDEMEKIRRLIERPFGELIFASAIVIGDGATERALLPPLIRKALKGRSHGICVVDPGSMEGDYATAVVKFACLIGVPWFLFSDSDTAGKGAVKRIMEQYASDGQGHVIWVPDESSEYEKGAATEKMLVDFDRELCERACEPLGYKGNGDVQTFMQRKKGVVGRLVALELAKAGTYLVGQESDGSQPWPRAICQLIDMLDAVLPKR
ncbi:AAA family ATPase [Amycolatopsis sp. NEAU-NG30]|uniref:AAA family ATPase n=1 Tax=Amycolatopsis melonis TaxID=3156488 RepID=A0ABV0LHF9_9PSEU